MSLYRKHRPQRFADIVGQDHVKRTIANAVAAGTVAHAYLFSGPRGVGKTSIARILAMSLNCELRIANCEKNAKKTAKSSPNSQFPIPNSEPCGSCQSCTEIRSGASLNVMEIDAASNRGIDEIRQLKEGIGFAPAGSGKKVYIIDEVHMLTKEAFNALLKTLEEPPAHAHFVLATTELHRVPDTIISRSQHFAFKRATLAEHRTHLKAIVKSEQLTIDDEALQLIAIHADGGFRDALTLLDQVSALGDAAITADSVRLVLGVAPEAELVELLRSSLAGNTVKVAASLESFAERGYDAGSMIDALILLLRQALWHSHGVAASGSEQVVAFATEAAIQGSPTLVATIERLIEAKQQLRWSPLPMLPVELALLPIPESRIENRELRIDVGAKQPAEPEQQKAAEPMTTVKPEAMVGAQNSHQEQSRNSQFAIRNSRPQKSPSSSLENPKEIWKQLLDSIRPKNAALAALLKSAALESIADGVCTIRVPFSFYADRVKDRKSSALIIETIATLTGITTTIACTVAGSEVVSPPAGEAGSNVVKGSSRTQEEVEKDVLEVFGAAAVEVAPSATLGVKNG